MPARKKRNAFGDIFRSRVTYHRDVAGERKQLQRQAMEERRQRLAEKKLRAQEIAAEAKIRAAERKIAFAEQKIETAAKKASRGASRASGGLSESEFDRIKAHMESEIAKQEDLKRQALARVGNPSWGFGVYQGKGFQTEQIAHFKSREAAETYARSHGLTGYRIQRAFAKNPRCRKPVRKGRGNPAVSASQYRLAQAVLSGTARDAHMSVEAAREIVDRTAAKLRSEYSRRNPAQEFSTEYHLGYNIGQADRQSAQLRKTLDELHATFAANFPPESLASWESFEQAYQAGYGGQMGAAAPSTGGTSAGNPRRQHNRGLSRNPEIADDGSEEYAQAKRTAELFHGRPVKEQIDVDEQIKTHDWYVSIGPLIKLIIKPLTKKPRARVPLQFHRSEAATVHLFTSPDGKQFYLRGGDQELDVDAFGMGKGTEWFRDYMIIGEAVEVTYEDRKKFHSFKLVEYYHKLGEVTRKKPALVYNSLSKKLSIIGGQYRIETEDLVEGMSPGIVN